MDAICTIADSTYASKAIAMLNSSFAQMPSCQYFLLDVDYGKPQLTNSHIQVLSLDEIDLDESCRSWLSRKYNVIEFATSVKPTLLRALLNKGFRSVTYLDPDILVSGPINEAIDSAEDYEVIIVPHRIRAQQTPNFHFEVLLNRVGIYNFGFLTVTQNSKQVLDWWEIKTFETGSMNWYRGQFTDQKWGDFFPAYFKTFVLKHPGYNVALWNIDERPLTHLPSGEVLARNEPLRFMHFSQSSHRLQDLAILKQWERASLESMPIVQSLALKYQTNIKFAQDEIEFKTPINRRTKFKPVKFRLNTRDSLSAGFKEDLVNVKSKIIRR